MCVLENNSFQLSKYLPELRQALTSRVPGELDPVRELIATMPEKLQQPAWAWVTGVLKQQEFYARQAALGRPEPPCNAEPEPVPDKVECIPTVFVSQPRKQLTLAYPVAHERVADEGPYLHHAVDGAYRVVHAVRHANGLAFYQESVWYPHMHGEWYRILTT